MAKSSGGGGRSGRGGGSGGLSVGSNVTLPKGLRVGMGQLSANTQGRIANVGVNDNGQRIYTVTFPGRNGRERSTTVNPSDLV